MRVAERGENVIRVGESTMELVKAMVDALEMLDACDSKSARERIGNALEAFQSKMVMPTIRPVSVNEGGESDDE